MRNACPLCKGPLVVQHNGKPVGERAGCYEDCLQECPRCRIGLTNATGLSRTFIRKDWTDGLWRRPTAARLETIVGRALNRRSHSTKRKRLAHERSEDLLTWNLFSWLEDHGLLDQLMGILGGDASYEVKIFYWGVNDRYQLPEDADLTRLLIERFRESPQSLSEPDVILVGHKSVVFVEAKLGSPNERRPHDARVDKYVTAMPECFVGREAVRAAGYYELTRNWAIGAAMATALGRDFTLVNLVRASDEPDIVEGFGRLLSTKGVFQRRTWEELSSLDPLMVPHLLRQTLHFEPAFPALDARSGAKPRAD